MVEYSPEGVTLNHMVEQHSTQLDAVFRALSDATRRGMLHDLAKGDRTVGELAAPYEMTFAGASKHVKTLENAVLLQRRVQGRTHVCSLDARALEEADAWLEFYSRSWNARLDALEQALADHPKETQE
jgi:DNA-binding transcriptional ArsR family regulator